MQGSHPFVIGPEEQQKALSKSSIKIHTLKTEMMESAKDFCDALSYLAVRGRGLPWVLHPSCVIMCCWTQASPTHTECYFLSIFLKKVNNFFLPSLFFFHFELQLYSQFSLFLDVYSPFVFVLLYALMSLCIVLHFLYCAAEINQKG